MKLSPLLLVLIVLASANAQNKSIVALDDNRIPASPLQSDLTPGYVLIEGDIQVPLQQYQALLNSFSGGRRPYATYGPATFWPAKTVPYDFVTTGGGAVSAANQTNANHAMDSIALRAGVIFRPAVNSDANRIRFQNSEFNNSPVGMQGGAQIINIHNWNYYIIMCHEIYHSLGFQHEQSRSDRGAFVTVNTANICGSANSTACTAGNAPGQCCLCQDLSGNCIDCAFNFSIVGGSSTYGPYDFDSFMHYGTDAFSCNGNATMSVNPPYTNPIGQRDHFSYFDGMTCRALYPFPNDRWLDRNSGGSGDGTFQHPYNSVLLSGALASVPNSGTLFVKYGNTYSGAGTYHTPVTIIAPDGPVTFGK